MAFPSHSTSLPTGGHIHSHLSHLSSHHGAGVGGGPSRKRTFSKPEWEQRMNEVGINKRDLNRLVLDYLILEGYHTAAQTFSDEATTDLPPNAAQQVEEANIDTRLQIREAVQRGDVQTAIEMCNDLDPEILDSHPSLHFHLLTQSLIELIRQGRTVDALKFAQTELAPRGEKNEEFLKELESVMCLLAFGAASNAADAKGKDRDTKRDPKVDAPAQLMGLLSMQQRDLTASELNAALLTSLSLGGPRGEPRIAALLRLCAWGEGVLAREGIGLPSIQGVHGGGIEVPKGEAAALEKGRADENITDPTTASHSV